MLIHIFLVAMTSKPGVRKTQAASGFGHQPRNGGLPDDLGGLVASAPQRIFELWCFVISAYQNERVATAREAVTQNVIRQARWAAERPLKATQAIDSIYARK
jgi:hypothetical protein